MARVEAPDESQSAVVVEQPESQETVRLASASVPAKLTTPPRARVNYADADIDELDRQLSLMIAEPAAEWQFDAIRARIDTLVENSPTAVDRGRAKRVQSEITRYERLRQDYIALDTIRAQTDAQNLSVDTAIGAALSAVIAPEVSRRGPEDFDGVGQLTAVVSRRAGAPDFALTDKAGDVVMFVSAAQGVDLDSHVGKVVGLTGTRGFMPQLKKPHLTARQIEPLDDAVLMARRP